MAIFQAFSIIFLIRQPSTNAYNQNERSGTTSWNKFISSNTTAMRILQLSAHIYYIFRLKVINIYIFF